MWLADSEVDCSYVPCSASPDSPDLEVFCCFFDISQIRKISGVENPVIFNSEDYRTGITKLSK